MKCPDLIQPARKWSTMPEHVAYRCQNCHYDSSTSQMTWAVMIWVSLTAICHDMCHIESLWFLLEFCFCERFFGLRPRRFQETATLALHAFARVVFGSKNPQFVGRKRMEQEKTTNINNQAEYWTWRIFQGFWTKADTHYLLFCPLALIDIKKVRSDKGSLCLPRDAFCICNRWYNMLCRRFSLDRIAGYDCLKNALLAQSGMECSSESYTIRHGVPLQHCIFLPNTIPIRRPLLVA